MGRFLIIALLGLLLFALAARAAVVGFQAQAVATAQRILAANWHAQASLDENLVGITAHVHRKFQISQANAAASNRTLLQAAKPYLTHRFLPSLFRFDQGAIETVNLDGHCDDAARALAFLLSQTGIVASQFNIVTPNGAHSVVLAEPAGERARMLDPLHGVVSRDSQGLIGPNATRDRVKTGSTGVFVSVAGPSGPVSDFYENFSRAVFAKQGDPLLISATLDLSHKTTFRLGTVDGRWQDVVSDGNKLGISPHWHYLGSRYDRAWTRQLNVNQPAQVEIVLTGPLNPGFITSILPPAIAGNTLIYRIGPGNPLILKDGGAAYDWRHLSSYQDIDQIIISRRF